MKLYLYYDYYYQNQKFNFFYLQVPKEDVRIIGSYKFEKFRYFNFEIFYFEHFKIIRHFINLKLFNYFKDH